MALTEKFGSKKEFKAAFKSSSGQNSGLFRRFKDGESVRVRFLSEMEDWEKGYYHWLNGKFLWCSRRDDCPGCEAGDRPKQIWLANALVRDDGKVQILQIPATIAKQLYRRNENNGTIMDRDYTISRTGATLNDTEYFLDYDDKSRFSADRYKTVDIASAIMQELGLSGTEDDEDDEEDEPPRRPAKKSKPTRTVRTSRVNRDDEEDDDEPEDEIPPGYKKKTRTIKASATGTKRVVRRS